jgi:hypothetical protein
MKWADGEQVVMDKPKVPRLCRRDDGKNYELTFTSKCQENQQLDPNFQMRWETFSDTISVLPC